MKSWGLAVLTVAALFLTGAVLQPTPTAARKTFPLVLELKAKALVKGPMVYLKEVATLKSLKPETQEMAANLLGSALIDAAKPGETTKLTMNQVARILYRKGVDTRLIDFKGAREAVITTNFKKILFKEVVNAIQNHLMSTEEARKDKVVLEYVAGSAASEEDIVLPYGEIAFQVTRGLNSRMKQLPVPFKILVDNMPRKSMSFKFIVHRWSEIPVAKKSIGRHGLIQDNDFDLSRVDLNEIKGSVVTDPTELTGKRTTQKISEGKPFTSAAVELPPLIKRGDPITVIAKVNGVVATTTAEAREDGRMGDVIKVININSNKELRAMVIGEKQVEVTR